MQSVATAGIDTDDVLFFLFVVVIIVLALNKEVARSTGYEFDPLARAMDHLGSRAADWFRQRFGSPVTTGLAVLLALQAAALVVAFAGPALGAGEGSAVLGLILFVSMLPLSAYVGHLYSQEQRRAAREGATGPSIPHTGGGFSASGSAASLDTRPAASVSSGETAAVEGVARRADRGDALSGGDVRGTTPTPTTGRSALEDGADDRFTLTSPGGESGVLLAATVVERDTPVHVPEEWDAVGLTLRAQDFRVADDTGTVRVEVPDEVVTDVTTVGATGVAADDARYVPSSWAVAQISPEGETPPEHVAAVATAADLDPAAERLRYREATLSPGDPVTVLGEVIESYGEPTVVPADGDPGGRFRLSVGE